MLSLYLIIYTYVILTNPYLYTVYMTYGCAYCTLYIKMYIASSYVSFRVLFFCFFKICLCFYCNQVQLSRSRNSTILTLIQILAFWFFQQYYCCSSSLRIYSLGLQNRSAYVPRFHFKHNLQIIGLR